MKTKKTKSGIHVPATHVELGTLEGRLRLQSRRGVGGHPVKLMPCKPFFKGKRSRRERRHTWVRI